MALNRAEQRKQAAMMRTAMTASGANRATPTARRRGAPDPGVSLTPTPPSEVPMIQTVGAGVTGVAAPIAGAAVGAAYGGPIGAVAGAIVGLIGLFTTSSIAKSKAKEEAKEAQHIQMANRKAMGQAALEQTRSERQQLRGDLAMEAASPASTARQEMMAPAKQGAPGAVERIASTLVRG
jgi:hypothetical protein